MIILRFALRCSLHHAANYYNVNLIWNLTFYLIQTAVIVSMINIIYVFLLFTGHFYPNEREDPLIPELPIETFNVKPGRFYRFRVINAAMLFSFRFSIDEVNTQKKNLRSDIYFVIILAYQLYVRNIIDQNKSFRYELFYECFIFG